jgi:outer membrane lipoprotein SlyB
MKNISIAFFILFAGITQAFAGNVQYVTPSEVNQVRKVEIGQIIGLKHVRVDESNFIRTAVGGGIGYAIGSQIGKGSGNKIAKIAGTLIGAGAAQKKTDATEITVRTERGRVISIIQKGRWRFKPNQTVKVMHGKQGKKSVSYVDSMY